MHTYKANGNLEFEYDGKRIFKEVSFECTIGEDNSIFGLCSLGGNDYLPIPVKLVTLKGTLEDGGSILISDLWIRTLSNNYQLIKYSALKACVDWQSQIKPKAISSCEYDILGCIFHNDELIINSNSPFPDYIRSGIIKIPYRDLELVLSCQKSPEQNKTSDDHDDSYYTKLVIPGTFNGDASEELIIVRDICSLLTFAKRQIVQWHTRKIISDSDKIVQIIYEARGVELNKEPYGSIIDPALKDFLREVTPIYAGKEISERNILQKSIYLYVNSLSGELFISSYILAFTALESLVDFYFKRNKKTKSNKTQVSQKAFAAYNNWNIRLPIRKMKDIENTRNDLVHSGEIPESPEGSYFNEEAMTNKENLDVLIHQCLISAMGFKGNYPPWDFKKYNTYI